MLIGTSGWQYADWRGVLYPPGVPQRRWLYRYSEVFATVENNNAFYRLPGRETFELWRGNTPPGFVMAVKASRYLTHMKRLNDPAEPVARLMTAAASGPKLGPVLLQLPPTLRAEPGRLDACLRQFPQGVRVAVEPRHPTWWTDETRRVLEERGAALCWTDRLGRPQTPSGGRPGGSTCASTKAPPSHGRTTPTKPSRAGRTNSFTTPTCTSTTTRAAPPSATHSAAPTHHTPLTPHTQTDLSGRNTQTGQNPDSVRFAGRVARPQRRRGPGPPSRAAVVLIGDRR